MVTTASHTAGLATRRHGAAAGAWPAFLSQLPGIFKKSESAAERRIARHLAGQRWCDATERQLLDSVIATSYGADKF